MSQCPPYRTESKACDPDNGQDALMHFTALQLMYSIFLVRFTFSLFPYQKRGTKPRLKFVVGVSTHSGRSMQPGSVLCNSQMQDVVPAISGNLHLRHTSQAHTRAELRGPATILSAGLDLISCCASLKTDVFSTD